MLCLQIDLFGRYVDRLVMSDNQAVRIPRELEMEGSEVLIRKEGDTLILTPIRTHTLRDLLASWAPLEDAVPEVEDLPAQPLR